MAYTALYRRFRPQRFEDLVGQDHIVRTLLNQLESGRIAHAYLFSGPRGTGKTSTAKLFARAINCACPKNGNPCGECEPCRSFTADDNMDIIEIDAASNNGVDSIRDIRDKIVFAPAYGKYKVYIIDEVHMLSGGAFNALLKTLEEPPKHAVFILATTEIHKIPATILSRCQRFDFKLISSDVIASRLEYALKKSNVTAETEAVKLIADCADGGMRDALSLADVCISYCGNTLTYEDVRRVLGLSDRSFVFSFTDKLIDGDTSGVIEKCRELENEGKDVAVFVSELMQHLRDVMICIYAPESASVSSLPLETKEKLILQAKRAKGERILRALEILASFEKDVKQHTNPEILLECASVRICLPQSEEDILSLCDRISVLEKKLENGITVNEPSAKPTRKTKSEDIPPWDDAPQVNFEKKSEEREIAPAKKEPALQTSQPKQASPAKTQSVSAPSDVWRALLSKIKQNDIPLYMMLRSFDGEITEGNIFRIYVPETAKQKLAIVTKNADALSSYLEEIKGQKYKIEAILGSRKPNDDNPMMRAALDLFS